jgi:TM2 domain-containing membrane protein YozV
MKSKAVAYLLWLVAIFGLLGFHRFYLGKIGTGIIWVFTLGVGGLGAQIDLFTLGGQVDQHNTNLELKHLKANALSGD